MVRDKFNSWQIVLILINTISGISSLDVNASLTVDLTYTGVVFSPYVKNRWPNGSIDNWKSYSFQNVLKLIDLTATKFQHITTYGMGVEDTKASWQDGNALGFSAMAAAEHNSKSNKKLSLTLGVWHNQNLELLHREVFNAIEAATVANNRFASTVWGVALSSFGYMGYRNWNDTLNFLEAYKEQAHHSNLQIGLRLEICEQIIPSKSVEDEYKDGLHSAPKSETSQPLSDIQKIARSADFLICNNFPPSNLVGRGVESTVSAMVERMIDTEKRLKTENANINIWFETGWPSAGIPWNGAKTTRRNLRTFWILMSKMSAKAKLQVYMFTAFDEPWKISNSKGKMDPQGPNGAESHWGWWTLVDKSNRNLSALREKFAEPDPEPEPETSVGLSGGATAGIVLVILIPIILFLAWHLYRARKTIQRISEKDIRDFLEGVPGDADAALQIPYDKRFELSKSDFVVDEADVLGSGAFGVVHKGKINGFEGNVAFKRPNKDITVSQLKNLLSEIKIMIYIGKHENIVVLLGAYTEQIREGIIYIASECCPLGSLESHLRNIPRTYTSMGYENITPSSNNVDDRYVNHDRKPIQKATSMPMGSLYKWSFQIASGMEYLANKRVVHADLATRNVLLTEDGTAKISDFGLSRRLYEYTQYVKCSQEPLPWRWMAIESLKKLTFTSMSDVWSFGVTAWEIFSLGDVPYPGLSWNVTFVDDLEHGLRMHSPKYATPAIYGKMAECWSVDPSARPSFTDLKEFFEILLCEEQKIG